LVDFSTLEEEVLSRGKDFSIASFGSPGRRKLSYEKWTQEQEQVEGLLRGLQVHENRWTRIKNDDLALFHNKNGDSLKDKKKNLNKAAKKAREKVVLNK